jgi:hypothetical protein
LHPLRRKKFENEILGILLYSEEVSDVRKEIKQYWKSQYAVNELVRFSEEQKEAFSFIRKVFKYHVYEKRDGSIVNAVLDLDGTIISDPDKVNQILIRRMKEVQFSQLQPVYTGDGPFYTLDPLSEEEFCKIIRRLAREKALAYDLISDDVYGQIRSTILRDIWSIDLGLEDYSRIFQCRLVALNKDHPRVPTYDIFQTNCSILSHCQDY